MKVLNLGSLNIDKTYTVDHFAEAGETIQATTYAEFCGGKGLNQSIALAKAGAEVFHAGCVGQDGAALIETLESAGVKTELIRTNHEPSGHAVIQVNHSGQNKIMIFGGANTHIPPGYIDQVLVPAVSEITIFMPYPVPSLILYKKRFSDKQVRRSFSSVPVHFSFFLSFSLSS